MVRVLVDLLYRSAHTFVPVRTSTKHTRMRKFFRDTERSSMYRNPPVARFSGVITRAGLRKDYM